MKRALCVAPIICLWASCVCGDSVQVKNKTQNGFDVWMRPASDEKYELVIRALRPGQTRRVNVAGVPFYIAISRKRNSYSFLGPFNYSQESTSARLVEINEKPVYETKSREVPYYVWKNGVREMRVRTYNYTVSHMVPELRTLGLKSEGVQFRDQEAFDGAVPAVETP